MIAFVELSHVLASCENQKIVQQLLKKQEFAFSFFGN